jgi:hypothetical protein
MDRQKTGRGTSTKIIGCLGGRGPEGPPKWAIAARTQLAVVTFRAVRRPARVGSPDRPLRQAVRTEHLDPRFAFHSPGRCAIPLATPPAGGAPHRRTVLRLLPPSRRSTAVLVGAARVTGANLMALVPWTLTRGNPPVAPARSFIGPWRDVEPSRDGAPGHQRAKFLTTVAVWSNRGAFLCFSHLVLACFGQINPTSNRAPRVLTGDS